MRFVTLLEWLRGLVVLDGALPLAVWCLPRLVTRLLPGERWPIEVLGVALPIAAFIARFFAGIRVVRGQGGHRAIQVARGILLFVGIFFLLVIDTAMILRLVMPAGAFRQRGDLIGFAALYAAYVVAMALATFPVRRGSAADGGGGSPMA